MYYISVTTFLFIFLSVETKRLEEQNQHTVWKGNKLSINVYSQTRIPLGIKTLPLGIKTLHYSLLNVFCKHSVNPMVLELLLFK